MCYFVWTFPRIGFHIFLKKISHIFDLRVYFFQISEEKPSKKTHKMQNEAGEYVDMYIPR